MKAEFCDGLKQKFLEAVCNIYGENLLSVILYGSFARDTATDESDIDIALLVKIDDKSMYESLLDVVVDLDLEYNQVISISRIESEKFEMWKRVIPYYMNIQKEGVVLWKAA